MQAIVLLEGKTHLHESFGISKEDCVEYYERIKKNNSELKLAVIMKLQDTLDTLVKNCKTEKELSENLDRVVKTHQKEISDYVHLFSMDFLSKIHTLEEPICFFMLTQLTYLQQEALSDLFEELQRASLKRILGRWK